MTARPRRCCGWPLCPSGRGQALGDARMGVPCRPRCYPGRRRGRALGLWTPAAGLAEWAGAAGFGLVAWGLGTEAPALAEVEKNIRRQQGTCCASLAQRPRLPPGRKHTRPPAIAVRPVRPCFLCSGMVIGVPWRLRHPRRLTVLAIATEAGRRVLCPPGGPGRAAAQAQDRRRLSPGRSRIGSPAAGSIG